jgi:hypothetical protein
VQATLELFLPRPTWITEGSVGPEGCAFFIGVLILSAVGIHVLFLAKPRPVGIQSSSAQ